MQEINCDGLIGYLDFLVADGNHILIAGIFDRTAYKTKAIGAKFGSTNIRVGYKTYDAKLKGANYSVSYKSIPLGSGRDHFWYCLAQSEEIGEQYLVTTEESRDEDVYNYLMKHYKLPLLKRWIPEILREADGRLIETVWVKTSFGSSTSKVLRIHGQSVAARDMLIYKINMSDAEFESVISSLLRSKRIYISDVPQKPLGFKDFNDYIAKYGSSLVENLEKEITPLCELKGNVDSLALKHKRLYPQQAACVNGMLALRNAGVKYGILNEGMGVGKTCQGMSIPEAYFVDKWLKAHPGSTLKAAYLDKDGINYRVFVMAPGHLVEKWAQELKAEIPFAKVEIITAFSQLIALRERGKKRHGREFYILSKDFCKLGSQLAPIPTKVTHQYVSLHICKDCYNERGLVFYKQGSGRDAECPDCHGKNFMTYPLRVRKVKGLICPSCNELLTSTSSASAIMQAFEDGEEGSILLRPKNFAKKSTRNSSCPLCGAMLWGTNVKPLNYGGHFADLAGRPAKWRKISHFKNCKKKTRETAFVLKGHESEYLGANGVTEYDYLASDYGPRKSAPSAFIKKYLKGYFDFCILDECHKYEGAGTAQANAAHALMKVSDFTLGLTGTISNGSAGSFFWLLWMLDPQRMKEKGYSYSSGECMRFCKQYGSVETLYEYSGREETYNGSSRGRQLESPKMKPGISPMLYVDFLLDRSVMLDITDLSKYLPPPLRKGCYL